MILWLAKSWQAHIASTAVWRAVGWEISMWDNTSGSIGPSR